MINVHSLLETAKKHRNQVPENIVSGIMAELYQMLSQQLITSLTWLFDHYQKYIDIMIIDSFIYYHRLKQSYPYILY